jgi:hypothetical protein
MNLWTLCLRRLRREFPATPRNRRARRVAERFRPSVVALEDRTVPTADMFAGATALTGTSLTATGSNIGATGETGERAPLTAADPINSVWWQWTAPVSGRVEVNTLGSDLDTILAVWTGTAVNDLTLVDADDDFYFPQSRVVFTAQAGTTYRISVDGYLDLTGDIVLNLATAPANDNFAAAIPVTVGTYFGSNTAATAEEGEPTGAGTSAPVNSVWWKWTAQTSELVEFNTFGSEFDTVLAVYSGSSLDTLQLVATNDDAEGGLQSLVVFQAQAGTTYYVSVDGSLQYTGTIVLNRPAVAGGRNHPPVINNGQTFSLNENSFGGTSVGTVVASDADPNQTLTYAIIGGNTSGAFSIDRATGEIRVDNGAALDYEVNPTFDLIVSVTDDQALSDSAVVRVNLVNLHDAPVFQEDEYEFSVAENSATDTPVGAVLATDSDPGQSVTYAITDGNTSGAFRIDAGTGEITVADHTALDFEATPAFRLTVTATDNGTPPSSSSAVVIVFVDDGNDAPVIADQTFSVNENSVPGTLAAPVAARDPDGGQRLTYCITGGDPAGAFAIDSATGRITVRDSSQLNFEVTPPFVLTVKVTDNGSPFPLSSTAAITINLNDVNEAATFVETDPFRVNENVPAGTVVGTVTANDQDNATTLTYAITSGNVGGAFAIDPSTGIITVANATVLDYELHQSFTLTIRATDNGTPELSVSTTVVVRLNDLNDAPVLDNRGAMSLVAINQGDVTNEGTLVSALLASTGVTRVADADAGATQGIAVVAADTTNGSWQYSTDGGSTWRALGSVSDESARLLAADALTRVRFVPAPGYNGTVAVGITFRAWDQTAGENGGSADASVGGGASAFSTATETASIKVRSALEQIAILSNDVRALMSTGALSNSEGTQLLSKLNHAKKHLEQVNPTPAENQMTFFMNFVSDLVQTGNLDPALGDDLIAKANAVIVSMHN